LVELVLTMVPNGHLELGLKGAARHVRPDIPPRRSGCCRKLVTPRS
jgi:hypothetical protein